METSEWFRASQVMPVQLQGWWSVLGTQFLRLLFLSSSWVFLTPSRIWVSLSRDKTWDKPLLEHNKHKSKNRNNGCGMFLNLKRTKQGRVKFAVRKWEMRMINFWGDLVCCLVWVLTLSRPREWEKGKHGDSSSSSSSCHAWKWWQVGSRHEWCGTHAVLFVEVIKRVSSFELWWVRKGRLCLETWFALAYFQRLRKEVAKRSYF